MDPSNDINSGVSRDLDELEQLLVDSIKACHDQSTQLSTGRHPTQPNATVASGVDDFVGKLRQIYVKAGNCEGQPHLTTNVLQEIDSGINPLFHLRRPVDELQQQNDAVRGKMANLELFRDAVDTYLYQSSQQDQISNTHALPRGM